MSSFEVQAGEVVSLIGPNGAGKSTILGVIAGDIKPDSGSVLLKNKRVGEYSYLELARLRALLLQKTQVAFFVPGARGSGVGTHPVARYQACA